MIAKEEVADVNRMMKAKLRSEIKFVFKNKICQAECKHIFQAD